jgi:hypothetical protein
VFEIRELRGALNDIGMHHETVTKHSPCLRVDAMDDVGAYPLLRLRRCTVHLWPLEFPNSRNRWESTPNRDTIPNLLKLMVTDFAWILAAHQDPE